VFAAMTCAGIVALLLSVQFLTQDWVWANWDVEDVLISWAFVLRDRLVVAFAIALLVCAAGTLPARTLRLRAIILAGSIITGALAGEFGLRVLANESRGLGGVVFRWSVIGLSIAGMFYLWRVSFEARSKLNAETLHRLQTQQQLASAHLIALKNQIEPHFLFNTLATVRRLQRTEPVAGALMLANFIDYLRRTMPMLDQPEVPLAQEVSLLRAYLAVISVRMSGRLLIELDVPPELAALPIPPLVLATLVENAIKHGLTPSQDGGIVRVAARAIGPVVEVAVEDTGVGFGAAGTGGSGIGLANARARLNAVHGRQASLRLEPNEPRGVRAVVTLPRVLPERAP